MTTGVKKFVGIDGCPSGWFCISRQGSRINWDICEDIETVWAQHFDAALILIDIPIGLRNDKPRFIEPIVRSALGPRRSSVFPVPCRDACYADDYHGACAANFLRWGKKISRQSWHICHKIIQVDQLLCARPEAIPILRESHPELVFSRFGAAPMTANKKTAAGLVERARLIQSLSPLISASFSDIRGAYLKKQLATDDIYDAMILLIAAGQATRLQTPTETGENNIPIQMCIPV